MVVGLRKRAVGVFSRRTDVERALHDLRNSGFAMDRVSVVARDSDSIGDSAGAEVTERVGDKADDGAKVGALSGGALGGLTGLLVGLGTLAIPGIGPIMLAGATATALATTVAGAGIGAAAGSLLGALVGLGIPEERARVYNERIERGHYLLIIEGTDAEIARAQSVLNNYGIEEFQVYDQPNGDNNVVRNAAINRRAIGLFSRQSDAEAALNELRNTGFSMNQVSVIVRDADNKGNIGGVNASSRVGNKADEGATAGAVTGGVLGGLTGLLVGLGTLAIPGVGPVIVAGEIATALATALTGGAIGAAAGGLVGALAGLGIPEDRAKYYSDRFNRGDYLVIVDGTDSEIHQAEAILKRRGIEDFAVYNISPDSTDRYQSTPGVYVNDSNYSSQINAEDPSVIIIDRRNERV